MSARGLAIRRRSLRATGRHGLAHNGAVSGTPITDALRTAPPGLHGDGEYWGLAWAALEWLGAQRRARLVDPRDRLRVEHDRARGAWRCARGRDSRRG